MTFEKLFSDVPYGNTVARRWAAADPAALNRAAAKIIAADADPWIFSGDERMFYQFAGEPEDSALRALSDEEREALLGPDWDMGWALNGPS